MSHKGRGRLCRLASLCCSYGVTLTGCSELSAVQGKGAGWRQVKKQASNLASLLSRRSARYSRLTSDGTACALHRVCSHH